MRYLATALLLFSLAVPGWGQVGSTETDGTTDQYVTAGADPIGAWPLSVCLWVQMKDAAANRDLFG